MATGFGRLQAWLWFTVYYCSVRYTASWKLVVSFTVLNTAVHFTYIKFVMYKYNSFNNDWKVIIPVINGRKL